MLCHKKSQTSSYKDGSSKGRDPEEIIQQAVLALLYVAFLHSDRYVLKDQGVEIPMDITCQFILALLHVTF